MRNLQMWSQKYENRNDSRTVRLSPGYAVRTSRGNSRPPFHHVKLFEVAVGPTEKASQFPSNGSKQNAAESNRNKIFTVKNQQSEGRNVSSSLS